MTKGIKRAIVYLLILAIIFLTLCTAVLAKNNEVLKIQNDVNVENNESQPVVDIGKTYTDIAGSSATIISKWNEVRAESYTLNKFVKIVLNSDWVLEGALQLDNYQRIIIDLNGHSITRSNLTSPVANGNIIAVKGQATLHIEDSVFASDPNGILEKAEQLSDNMTLDEYADNPDLWEEQSKKLVQDIVDATGIGYIGGGNVTDAGGAIWVSNATLQVDGGMICNSSCHGAGGGIYIGGQTSVLQFNNGIVCSNFSNSGNGGGGVYSDSPICNINGGLFVGNRTINRGSAIRIDAGKMSNCVVKRNWQVMMGSLYLNNHSRLMLTNVRVEGNVSTDSSGAGAYITGNETGSIIDMYNVSFIGNKCLGNTEDSGGGIQICYASSVYLQDCIFKDNYATAGGAGIDFSSKGTWDKTSKLQIGGFLDMSGNVIADGTNCDIKIKSNGKIRIESPLKMNEENTNQKPIYLSFVSKDGLFHTFTSSYSTFPHDIDPNKYFTCGIDDYAVVLSSNGELMFAKNSEACEYDFMFLENNKRKNYSENEKIHGYNDSDIQNYILGKILTNTSVKYFVERLAPLGIDKNNMKLYDGKNKLIYENGSAGYGISESLLDNGKELAVGTGWYFIANGETIYLSVLGDVNGDGRISASDVSYLRQIANDSTLYESLSLEKKLASMVINKGKVTSADAEIVRNAIDKLLTINIFF